MALSPVTQTALNPSTKTIVVVCTYDNTAVAATPYVIQVVQAQNAAGAPPLSLGFVPYTVDFKVDGDTVPELSGTMSVVDGPFFLGTANTRTFRFTNEGGRSVVDTELEPEKGGDYLDFILTEVGGGTTDTYEITPLAQPTDITTMRADVCGAIDTPITLPAGPAFCPLYADNVDGAFEYRFTLEASAAVEELIGFDLDIASNGVVIPGGPEVTPMSGSNLFVATFMIRGDGPDTAPTVVLETPPLLIEFTFTTAAAAVSLNEIAPPTGANCAVSQGYNPAEGLRRTVIVSCRDYAAGMYDYTFGNAGATDVTYTTSVLGTVVPSLSGTVATLTTSIQIQLTTPATPGDAVSNDMVTIG